MITAENFLETDKSWNKTTAQMLIEFAKIHVEAALEARDRLYQTHFNELKMFWTEQNKKFIKDSYSLENIK